MPLLLLSITSLKTLIRSTLLGQHESFDNIKNPEAHQKSIEEVVLNYLSDYTDAHFISNISSQPVLCQNICNHILKILLIGSLVFKQGEGAGLVKVVLQAFFNILSQ